MEFYDWEGALLFKIGSFDNYYDKTTVQLRRGEQIVGINNKFLVVWGFSAFAFIIGRFE